jgi:hypothetical protein
VKSVTFSWTNGQVEIKGVLIPAAHSPITYSNDDGLADIAYDATAVTTSVAGGTDLFIFSLV